MQLFNYNSKSLLWLLLISRSRDSSTVFIVVLYISISYGLTSSLLIILAFASFEAYFIAYDS